jgi:hypothetical protein
MFEAAKHSWGGRGPTPAAPDHGGTGSAHRVVTIGCAMIHRLVIV